MHAKKWQRGRLPLSRICLSAAPAALTLIPLPQDQTGDYDTYCMLGEALMQIQEPEKVRSGSLDPEIGPGVR